MCDVCRLLTNSAVCLLVLLAVATASCHSPGLPNSLGPLPIQSMVFGRVGAPLVGQVAPALEGRDLDGAMINLSDFRGKVVVLFFWNNWSPPSRGSFEFARVLRLKFENQPFIMLGINNDESAEQAVQIAREKSLHWRTIFDEQGQIAKDYEVETWPTFLVIDPNGKIVCRDSRKSEIETAAHQLCNAIPGVKIAQTK